MSVPDQQVEGATQVFYRGCVFTVFVLLPLSWMLCSQNSEKGLCNLPSPSRCCLANSHSEDNTGEGVHICWSPHPGSFVVQSTSQSRATEGASSFLRSCIIHKTYYHLPLLGFSELPKQVQSHGQFSPYFRVTLPTVYTGLDVTT